MNARADDQATHDRDVVVVCGAGAAGMAAALSAARAGVPVRLLEARPQMGGTVAHALIHTLGGLYGSDGALINDGLPAELVTRLMAADPAAHRRQMGRTWVLSVSPHSYQAAVQTWIAEQERIAVSCRTSVVRAVCDGDRIEELELLGPQGRARLRPRAVIDATGEADVVRQIDPRLVEDDLERAAGGFIFTMRGIAPGTLAPPRGLGILRALRSAAEEGSLTPDCGKAWIDVGVHEDEVYVKLFVPLNNGWREAGHRRRIARRAEETQAEVTAFLRRLPGFASAVSGRTGSLGVRDGGRVRGEYCLSVADVRGGRQFDDPACRGCWPIEYWDPVDGVSIEYLPDGCDYQIPLRALRPRGIQNLWVAGKCLSADRLAQASARVVGTCWAMGAAAGTAAARA